MSRQQRALLGLVLGVPLLAAYLAYGLVLVTVFLICLIFAFFQQIFQPTKESAYDQSKSATKKVAGFIQPQLDRLTNRTAKTALENPSKDKTQILESVTPIAPDNTVSSDLSKKPAQMKPKRFNWNNNSSQAPTLEQLFQIAKDSAAPNTGDRWISLSEAGQLAIRCHLIEKYYQRRDLRYSWLEYAEAERSNFLGQICKMQAARKEAELELAGMAGYKMISQLRKRDALVTRIQTLDKQEATIRNGELRKIEWEIDDVISRIEADEASDYEVLARELDLQLHPSHATELAIAINQRTQGQFTYGRNQQPELEEFRATEAPKVLSLDTPTIRQRDDLRAKIREVALSREIAHLVHFTPAENLRSILTHGLLSREALRFEGIRSICPDEQRLDRWLDRISLSVTFPNYKMFLPKRKNMAEKVSSWAVLLFRREVLWEKDCIFLPANASMGIFRALKPESLSSCAAFSEMFSNEPERINIPKSYTTDPQAEVMVQGAVSLEYLSAIIIDGDSTRVYNEIPDQYRGFVKLDPSYFRWREDWQQWQR